MARRADHSREELKGMILTAASDIVKAEGFADLTARRIANAIGYAPGTIYNLFGSMDDIYLTINAHTLDKLYDVLSSSACNDPALSSLENLKAMARSYESFARANRHHWLMLFNSRLPENRQKQEWYRLNIDRLFEPLEGLLTPLFPPKNEAQIKIATRTLFSAVHGLCFLQETGRVPLINQQNPATNMTDYLIETFVRGILTVDNLDP